jgi:hypothetical protein
MPGLVTTILIFTMLVMADVLTPALLVWSWIRLVRNRRLSPKWTYLSAISLLFATASACLAIGAFVYGRTTGGFAYYDPRLMKIYRYGMLSSLSGITVGSVGAIRKNSIRWQAPAVSFGVFLFWFLAAAGE